VTQDALGQLYDFGKFKRSGKTHHRGIMGDRNREGLRGTAQWCDRGQGCGGRTGRCVFLASASMAGQRELSYQTLTMSLGGRRRKSANRSQKAKETRTVEPNRDDGRVMTESQKPVPGRPDNQAKIQHDELCTIKRWR